MLLNCMVVDDDEISRLVLKQFIEKTDFLTLSHEFDNAKDASDILLGQSSNEVDVVFLDVEMPEMTGIDLIQQLETAYNVIMVTAKEEYAVDAFKGSVADYLIKPPEYERFLEAAQKVQDRLSKERVLAEQEDYIFVKSDGKYFRLAHQDILYIEALADYVIFNLEKTRHIVHCTMKRVEKRLPASKFSRIHRSYIVNRDRIEKIEDLHAHIGKKALAIGASYKDRLMKKINML